MGREGQSGPEEKDNSLVFETMKIQPHQQGEEDSDPVKGFHIVTTFSDGLGVVELKLVNV